MHSCQIKDCLHQNIKYCQHCDSVYCKKCGRQWYNTCTLNHWSYTFTNEYPKIVPLGNTLPNTVPIVPETICMHS